MWLWMAVAMVPSGQAKHALTLSDEISHISSEVPHPIKTAKQVLTSR